MKAIDFLNKFTDKKIPTFVRNIAEKAVNELNEGNFESIDVTESELHALSRYADYPIIKARIGTPFIRIYDELDNGKDIQIFNPWEQ